MRLFAPIAGVAIAALSSSAVLADTQIHAEYGATYDRIRPDPFRGINLRHSFDVTLSGTNDVKETGTRQAGPMSDSQQNRSVLGQRATDGNTAWKVAGPDRLERTVDGPQSVMKMVITTSGNSCKLDVNFELKSGFKEFMFKQIRNGQMGYFTQPKITSTTCTIK